MKLRIGMCIRNCRGQGMVETVAISFALVTVLSSLGGVLYFAMVHAGMGYLMHEHLVCEQTKHEEDCTRVFKTKAQAWLFKSRIYSFQSTKAFGTLRARLQITMPMNRMMTLTKEMPVLQ